MRRVLVSHGDYLNVFKSRKYQWWRSHADKKGVQAPFCVEKTHAVGLPGDGSMRAGEHLVPMIEHRHEHRIVLL